MDRGTEVPSSAHFILWCPAYEEPRKKNKILQQPYEDQEKNIGNFLFEENIREAKETLCIPILENKRIML